MEETVNKDEKAKAETPSIFSKRNQKGEQSRDTTASLASLWRGSRRDNTFSLTNYKE